MLDTLQQTFSSSQLLSGGVALALLGIAAMWLRELPGRFVQWAKHFFVTMLKSRKHDTSFIDGGMGSAA